MDVSATPAIPELAEEQHDPIATLKIRPRATSIQLNFGAEDNRPVKQIAPLGPADSVLSKGGFVAGCVDGAVVAPFDIDPELYAPEVVVAALQNVLDVEVTIEHAGASWKLAPNERVTLPPGDAAHGDEVVRHLAYTWTIRAAAPGGCNDPARPNKLGVAMTLECLQ